MASTCFLKPNENSQAPSPFSLPFSLSAHRCLLLLSFSCALSSKCCSHIRIHSLFRVCAHSISLEWPPYFFPTNHVSFWVIVYILILKNGIVFTFMEVSTKECRGSKFLNPRVTHLSKMVALHWEGHRPCAEEGVGHPPVQLAYSILTINKRVDATKDWPHQPYSHLSPLIWPSALDWSLLKGIPWSFSHCTL